MHRSRKVARFPFVVAVLLAIGCSSADAPRGDATGALVGACTHPAASPLPACWEYFGAVDVARIEKACATASGAWSNAACPTLDRIGGCRLIQGGATAITWFYRSEMTNRDAVAKACAAGGQAFVEP